MMRIIRVAEVRPGDILVSKGNPKGNRTNSGRTLAAAIFGENGVRDTSCVPHGEAN